MCFLRCQFLFLWILSVSLIWVFLLSLSLVSDCSASLALSEGFFWRTRMFVNFYDCTRDILVFLQCQFLLFKTKFVVRLTQIVLGTEYFLFHMRSCLCACYGRTIIIWLFGTKCDCFLLFCVVLYFVHFCMCVPMYNFKSIKYVFVCERDNKRETVLCKLPL